MAAIVAGNQAIRLRKILSDLHFEQEESTRSLWTTKQLAIVISYNPIFMERLSTSISSYIFIIEVQKNGVVTLLYCKSEDRVVDIFTKPLPTGKFEFVRQKLGLCNS